MRGRSSQKSGDSDMKETIEEIKESTKPQWTAKEVDKKTGCFYVLLLHSLRSVPDTVLRKVEIIHIKE